MANNSQENNLGVYFNKPRYITNVSAHEQKDEEYIERDVVYAQRAAAKQHATTQPHGQRATAKQNITPRPLSPNEFDKHRVIRSEYGIYNDAEEVNTLPETNQSTADDSFLQRNLKLLLGAAVAVATLSVITTVVVITSSDTKTDFEDTATINLSIMLSSETSTDSKTDLADRATTDLPDMMSIENGNFKKNAYPDYANAQQKCVQSGGAFVREQYCVDSSKSRTWVESKNFCQGMSGKMIQIENKEKNNEVANLISERYAWISLQRKDKTSPWQWSIGSTLLANKMYSNWVYPVEKNCAMINGNSYNSPKTQGKWKSFGCIDASATATICEF